jgi:hypothetical protein
MELRFDLHSLRARYERLGRPGDVVGYGTQPWRWLIVRYLLGLVVLGYLFCLEGLFLRLLGPMDLAEMALTLVAPIPFVALLARRERGRLARQVRP